MKHTVIVLLITLSFFKVQAQVQDISVTFSPAAEYTWWDDMAGLEDGTLVGGKLGFGFGEYIELRGLYFQSTDLRTNFENFGLENYSPDLFNAQNLTLRRYGGEFKGNIGTQRLMPYVTLGTGVQRFELQGSEDIEQIYASVGLGIKLKIADRAVFAIEAKNTMFNANAGATLLSEENQTAFGVTDADFTSSRLSNWGVLGSLEFYLGGRKPGTLTDLDRAYLSKFKGGFRGLQVIVEPSINYLAFDTNSQFRDTYLLGGYAGVDFNEYIGVRAFYLQATENEEISTDFDNLALYGVEFRARLNDGNGVTPYLILGGGYMNAYGTYRGINNNNAQSSEFASGGLGLNIPLGKRFLITGGARAMVTSGESIEDLTSPSNIQTHVMYNAGLKFIMGKKSKAPQDVYANELNSALAAQQAENNAKIQDLKYGYRSQVDSLQRELAKAYEAKDVDKAILLMKEKKEAQTALAEVDKLETLQEREVAATKPANIASETEKQTITAPIPTDKEMIRMTPAEFESLIIRILENIDNPKSATEGATETEVMEKEAPQNIEQLQNRIQKLERRLERNEDNKGMGATAPSATEERTKTVTRNKVTTTTENKSATISEVEEAKQNATTEPVPNKAAPAENNSEVAAATVVSDSLQGASTSAMVANDSLPNSLLDTESKIDTIQVNSTEKFLTYNSGSAMVGYNVGGVSTLNLGARLHYNIRNTNLEFMPEAYIGLGNENTYGASGNIVYAFNAKNDKISPYAGVGLGFLHEADSTIGHYNLLVGTQLPFVNKNLYVDYTMRNTFDYNQLALTYRLKF